MNSHSAAWMLVLCLAAGGAVAGEPVEDDETDWSYARPEILKQRGPKLGRHGFSAVVRAAFPKLRRPGKHVLVEEGDPVIGQLIALRGRFLVVDDEQVRPGPHAVALLVVWETDEGDSISWVPELIVVGLVDGRLRVLGRQQLEDLNHDFTPGQDGGSAYRLEAWPLHPKGAGIGVRLDQISAGSAGRSVSAQLIILFIGLPEQDLEDEENGELLDVFMRTMEESSLEHTPGEPAYGEVTRIQVRIDRQLRSGGLYVLETEQHHSTSEAGRVRHVEIDYEWQCWQEGGFDICEEEALNPPAPAVQAR